MFFKLQLPIGVILFFVVYVVIFITTLFGEDTQIVIAFKVTVIFIAFVVLGFIELTILVITISHRSTIVFVVASFYQPTCV